MNQGVQFHFIHKDIYKGGKDGEIPLYFLPLTSVTPIDDDNSVSNLNTCQTNAAKDRGIKSFKKNKDRIIDALEQTGIKREDLNDFMKKFAKNSKNPMILLRECLGKMGKDFAGRYMNCNGIGDKDFADVLRDDEYYKINFLYSFTDGTEHSMDIWGDNIDSDGKVSLKTILYDKDDPRTVNLARNFWKFLNQGEEPYKVEDFKFLNQDVFIERCKGSKNNNDNFTIYNAEDKLNETGQLIYDELCKKLSNRINPEKILQHLEGWARETVSACEYKCSEIEAYIDDVCEALAFKFNEDKYFPEEIYKQIKIENEILNDSFATIHYFQCIVTACIMHFSSVNAEAYIRNNIIDGIIRVRTDFEKITLEKFEDSEYALTLAPAEKSKVYYKKILWRCYFRRCFRKNIKYNNNFICFSIFK